MPTPQDIDETTRAVPAPTLGRPGGGAPDLDSNVFALESRFVALDGHRVHYVDEGRGPVVLFVHGNMGWSYVYHDVILALRDAFRCVALDLPGFGLSQAAPGFDHRPAEQAAVLDRFMAALELTDVTMMVNDWGGPIGLSVAGEHPERFRGLILANMWAWPVDDDPHFRRFSTVLGSAPGHAALTRMRPFFNLLLRQTFHRRKLSAAEWAQLTAPYREPAARRPCGTLVREIKRSGPWLAEVHSRLDRLCDHPALVIWGERDGAFTTEHRERVERLFPAAQTVLLADAGNFVALDAPADVAGAIRDWHTRS